LSKLKATFLLRSWRWWLYFCCCNRGWTSLSIQTYVRHGWIRRNSLDAHTKPTKCRRHETIYRCNVGRIWKRKCWKETNF